MPLGYTTLRIAALRVALGALGLFILSAGTARAQMAPLGGDAFSGSAMGGQSVPADPANAPSQMPPPPPEAVPSGFMKVLQAICWYLPNRLADLSDIPRVYLSLGDGLGLSVRATRYLTATWFEDNAYCLGWTMRKPPWFSEEVQEHYLGFLAAQEGDLDRDPTEVGISVHFLVLGFNAAISLGEGVDFLAGVAGIDLSGDDHGPVMVDKTQPDPVRMRLQQQLYPERPRQEELVPRAPAEIPPAVIAPPAAAPTEAAPQANVTLEPALPSRLP